MAKHAILSASGAHRWINCSKAPLLEKEFEDSQSEAARIGTAAHELSEFKLKKMLGIKTRRPESEFQNEEMEVYSDDYVTYVLEQIEEVKKTCKDPLVLIEERVNFSKYVPEGFGTADVIILGDSFLHVIDLKFGYSFVQAENNPQMKLYALGVLQSYESLYDIDEVTLHVFQPRRENISSWTISVVELKEWAEKVLKPKAELAFKGEGEYLPGEWCTFCRAAVKCRARAEEKLRLAESEFKLPPLLSDSEVEEVLSKLSDLTKWANEIMAYATDAAVNHGKEWSGFKVVEGRSIRKYKDQDKIAEKAKENGYKDIYRQSLIPLTEMEKLMGKARFKEVLGDLIIKPRGKPTLVPLSDKRKAINVSSAKNEFNKIMEVKNYE